MLYEGFLDSTFEVSNASQAISDPFSALIADPSKPRSILLRTDLLELDGVTVYDLDVSTDGYKSLPADSPYQQFPERLINPYNFSVSLPLPEISGSTQLGIGNISLENANGALDVAARKDWLGREQNLYLGPPEPAGLSEFTKIQKGVSAGVQWDLDTVSVINRDQRFRIQRPLHRSRYKGFGACLRGNGTSSLANCTLTCPAGNVTFECDIRPATSANALKYLMSYQNGAAAGGRFLRFMTGSNNLLQWFVINDALTQYAISFTGLPIGILQRVTGVLDATGVLGSPAIYLYVDGESVATPVAVAGTFNTVMTAFASFRRPDTAAGYLDGDLDNITIWPVARTQAQIRESRSRELLGTEGQTALWKLNEGSGAGPAANSVAAGVGLTLTNTTWVGSLEGDSALVGTVKPVALGVCRQVEPKWVDTQRLVVQVHNGSSQGILAVRDSGDPLTFGADLSDIYSAVPAAGTYNTQRTTSSGTYIRFGSTPVGAITVDIQGDNGGVLGYADTVSEIDRKLMVDYAGLSNTLDVDGFAYDSLQALNSAVTGRYYDEPINIDVASNEIRKDIGAWGGPTRVGVQTVGRIDDPVNLNATVAWTLANNLDQSAGQAYNRVPFGVRYREVVVGYKPYYRTLSPDQIAGAVGLATRNDYGQQYRYVSKEIIGASADGATLTILTGLDLEADAKLEMERLAAFLGRDLEVVTVALTSGLLSHFIGTVVSLTLEQEQSTGVLAIRYGTNGKKYVVVGVSEVIAALQPDRFSAVLLG